MTSFQNTGDLHFSSEDRLEAFWATMSSLSGDSSLSKGKNGINARSCKRDVAIVSITPEEGELRHDDELVGYWV